MAVSARSESTLDTGSPLPRAANDGYGSLMGMSAPRKKKKPVLVLDAEEIAKAHLAMAASAAQIMEESVDPDYIERPRAPATLLGLAPLGANDAEAEDASAYPPIPDASNWEGEEEPLLAQVPEEYTDEGELAEPVEDVSPACNVERLLSPPAAERDEEGECRASVIALIEKQLKRMRALPTALTDEEVSAEEAGLQLRSGPMERLNQIGYGSDDLSLSVSHDDPWPVPDEPAEATAADEPFELSEPEIAPEPMPRVQSHVGSMQHFDDLEYEPDLSWLEPEAGGEMQIASGDSSALRARGGYADNIVVYEQQPSLQQPSLVRRLIGRIAGLFRR